MRKREVLSNFRFRTRAVPVRVALQYVYLVKLVCLNIVFQSITRELNPVILSLIISLSLGSVSFSLYLILTSLRKKVESAKNRGLKSNSLLVRSGRIVLSNRRFKRFVIALNLPKIED